LENDLSSNLTDLTGRHPLPDFRALTRQLQQWGVTNQSQVIVYDDAGGAFAGRLWWLLRYLGHDKIAVLDGGINHWQQLAYPMTTILPKINPSAFRPYPSVTSRINAFEVQNALASKSICLIDARASERFHGKNEPIDPIAGHIPGAINRPFQLNLGTNGLFLSPQVLSKQFKDLIGNRPSAEVVHMCGSGVTACHNLLAMEYAGLSSSKLYPGSWSEWIRNKNRAIAND
jgi:thiosulfate/3-mercaptopyruvate sulfurtransferase